MNTMLKIRDTFRELADITDQFILLKEKEEAGEDIKTECENITGKFILKMLELESLKAEL